MDMKILEILLLKLLLIELLLTNMLWLTLQKQQEGLLK